ncbi:acyltransferase family protein [Paenibacillus sp. UNC451MF]|uniref:acyltransferase family protein n=1 Tax=Paenibacillus sp. UNC451MF TaxID=1449063 RepID=UPI00048D5D43|nr:acyltransferase [Paenibacillus sp. UNC451MF]
MEKRFTIPYIQAARGIAVVLVMLFHASQMANKYFQINFLGVSDMGRSGGYAYFFVLTGFLMYTLYQRHFGHAEMWLSFIVKRFLRIYPLYWLVTLAVIPVYFLMPSFGLGFETKPAEIVRSLLLVPGANPPILGVAWSLIYIVFFYIAFSLLFVLRKPAAFLLFTVWVAIIGLNSLGWIHLKDNLWIRFLFDGFHLEFMLGIAVAFFLQHVAIRKSRMWLAAGIAVFPIVWGFRHVYPDLSYVNTLYTLGSALVLVGIGSLKVKAPEWLKPLQFLGDASYSILLTSLVCLSITLKVAKAAHMTEWISPAAVTSLCFLAALVMCCVFYAFIEKPLVQRLKQLLLPKIQPTAAASK